MTRPAPHLRRPILTAALVRSSPSRRGAAVFATILGLGGCGPSQAGDDLHAGGRSEDRPVEVPKLTYAISVVREQDELRVYLQFCGSRKPARAWSISTVREEETGLRLCAVRAKRLPMCEVSIWRYGIIPSSYEMLDGCEELKKGSSYRVGIEFNSYVAFRIEDDSSAHGRALPPE